MDAFDKREAPRGAGPLAAAKTANRISGIAAILTISSLPVAMKWKLRPVS